MELRPFNQKPEYHSYVDKSDVDHRVRVLFFAQKEYMYGD